MHLAADGDVLLLHRFQQRRLGFRRRPIDLIGEDNIGEHRTALKLKDFAPRSIVGEHIGAGDVRRHEIRRKLHPGKSQAQAFAEAAHHQGLAQPGHSFEQTMAAADQRNKNLLDQIFMADNDARHLRFQFVEGTLRALDAEFNLVHGFHRRILLNAELE